MTAVYSIWRFDLETPFKYAHMHARETYTFYD